MKQIVSYSHSVSETVRVCVCAYRSPGYHSNRGATQVKHVKVNLI